MVAAPRVELSDSRRCALLDAAISVFIRFGFRKTSMEDVARAAGVSRQGLYLQFSNKEELFRRAVEHSLSNQLTAAIVVLKCQQRRLDERLIDSCDQWCGRFVGLLSPDAADLITAGASLAGETFDDYGRRFEQALAEALADSPMARVCEGLGLDTSAAAHVLHATARGLKQACGSRQEFREAMTVAVRMFCAPSNQQCMKQ